MKVRKNSGEIRLRHNEKRLGNFIIGEEGDHLKIQDINSTLTHRVHRRIVVGRFLEAALKGLRDEAVLHTLTNYVTVLWNVSCTVPDMEFMLELQKAAEACAERHPEFYGGTARKVGDEEDKEIIEGLKEEAELKEQLAGLEEDN